MQIRIIFIMLTIILLFNGCISYDYSRQIVQQGNLLSENQLKKLKIGMSKDDVAILMGTSLLNPVFANNRWDYAYTWQKYGKLRCIKSVSLTFNSSNRLQHIDIVDRCNEDMKRT